jgi:catechol 2,3-dioxygenase-like lactoylglutathione lyase family enzyme
MIESLDHIAIVVTDLQETIDFYAKLGFSPGQRSETPDMTIQFLEAGSARLEVLVPKETSSAPESRETDVGIKHIALKVNDIWKTYEVAKARGVIFSTEPRRTPMGNIATFFRDPSGISVQLLQRGIE